MVRRRQHAGRWQPGSALQTPPEAGIGEQELLAIGEFHRRHVGLPVRRDLIGFVVDDQDLGLRHHQPVDLARHHDRRAAMAQPAMSTLSR